MPVLTEPPSMGDVLKYEVNPNYTREVVTLLIGTALSGRVGPRADHRQRQVHPVARDRGRRFADRRRRPALPGERHAG